MDDALRSLRPATPRAQSAAHTTTRCRGLFEATVDDITDTLATDPYFVAPATSSTARAQQRRMAGARIAGTSTALRFALRMPEAREVLDEEEVRTALGLCDEADALLEVLGGDFSMPAQELRALAGVVKPRPTPASPSPRPSAPPVPAAPAAPLTRAAIDDDCRRLLRFRTRRR